MQFIARIIFRIKLHGADLGLFDEQIRLILAHSREEALAKAKTIGRKEEAAFKSDSGEMIRWEFVDVIELEEMEEVKDGTLICSFTKEEAEAEDYINFVKLRAETLNVPRNFLSGSALQHESSRINER
jgi:hypothetical protein